MALHNEPVAKRSHCKRLKIIACAQWIPCWKYQVSAANCEFTRPCQHIVATKRRNHCLAALLFVNFSGNTAIVSFRFLIAQSVRAFWQLNVVAPSRAVRPFTSRGDAVCNTTACQMLSTAFPKSDKFALKQESSSVVVFSVDIRNVDPRVAVRARTFHQVVPLLTV